MLTILSTILMQTPRVNPSNTPYADSIVTNTPDWMYSWWFIGICAVFIGLGVYGLYKHLKKVPGAGYVK